VPRLREFRYDSWAEWTYGQLERVAKHRPRDVTLAVDTETTGTGFYDEPFAATVTFRGLEGQLISGYFDLEGPGRESRLDLLSRMMRQLATSWVGHNLKFDLQKLILAGGLTIGDVNVATIHDTQTQFTLLDENSRKGLKVLAVSVLHEKNTIEVPYKSGPKAKLGLTRTVVKEDYRLQEARTKLGLKKEDGYHLLPRPLLIPYALKDTEFTLRLHETLMPRLERLNDPAILQLYTEAMQLKRVLLRMEADGLGVDIPYLDKTTSEYGVKVMHGWSKVVDLVGNPEFNPQSPQQVMEAFAARGVTLETTEAKTLERLDDELARALLAYRGDKRVHTTYLQNLQRERRGEIVHANFNDDAARTGRMSSSSASE